VRSAVVPSVNCKWKVKEIPTPKPSIYQSSSNKDICKWYCYTDVHITHGILGVNFPNTIGHEPAGEIVCQITRRSY
jgi:alcohol dehydrogenase